MSASAATLPVLTLSTATSVCFVLPGRRRVARWTSLNEPTPICVAREKVSDALCGGELRTGFKLPRCNTFECFSSQSWMACRREMFGIRVVESREAPLSGDVLFPPANHCSMLARS